MTFTPWILPIGVLTGVVVVIVHVIALAVQIRGDRHRAEGEAPRAKATADAALVNEEIRRSTSYSAEPATPIYPHRPETFRSPACPHCGGSL